MNSTPAGSHAPDFDQEIVCFILDRDQPVPAAVLDTVSKCALDFMGNACFAAQRSERKDALLRGIAGLCEPVSGTASLRTSVIGRAEKYNYTYAALLNGAFAHVLDFDDTSSFGAVHPSVVIFPPLLAVGELEDSRWGDIVDAAAVGIEIACRVGASIGPTAYDRGFHITPIGGIFGAVAGIARLKGVGPDVLTSALALAGSQAAGSMQYLENGAWNKCLHPGFAAHSALIAFGFAEAGVLGASHPITGQYGVLTSYSNAPRPDLLIEKLGEWWAAGDVAIKPYPSCRLTHGATEAAFVLREKGKAAPSPQDRLVLTISSKAYQIVGVDVPNKRRPTNSVDAQFSAYFQCAVAWLHGAVTLDSYDLIDDPAIIELMANIDIRSDDAIPTVGAELSCADGVVRIDWPSGEPENPIDWDGVVVKFSHLATSILGDTATKHVIDHVQRQDSNMPLRQLMEWVEGK